MLELFTQSRSVEVTRLHDHLVMWQFARTRYEKYGFQEPEATILFDTLRRSCTSLEEKDAEFKFSLQSFIRENSSVNGLVTKQSVYHYMT